MAAKKKARPKAKARKTKAKKRSSKKKTVKKKARRKTKKAKKKTAKRKKTAKKRTAKKKAAKKKAKRKPKAAKKKTLKKRGTKKKAVKKKAKRKPKAPKKRPAVKKTAVSKPRPAVEPPTRQPLPSEERIGVVTHYYSHLSVAIIRMETGVLCEGDTIHIKGHTSDFRQQAKSMEINHIHVSEVSTGQVLGLRVTEHAREHDVVFKVS